MEALFIKLEKTPVADIPLLFPGTGTNALG